MTAPVTVRNLDHIVLNVADPEASVVWYTKLLGLSALRLAEFRAGKAPFPSMQVCPGVIIDLDPRSPRTGTNIAHFCLVLDEIDLFTLAESGQFTVVAGPFRRWGALGEADLIYVKDPDGNVIELRHYGPSQLADHPDPYGATPAR